MLRDPVFLCHAGFKVSGYFFSSSLKQITQNTCDINPSTTIKVSSSASFFSIHSTSLSNPAMSSHDIQAAREQTQFQLEFSAAEAKFLTEQGISFGNKKGKNYDPAWVRFPSPTDGEMLENVSRFSLKRRQKDSTEDVPSNSNSKAWRRLSNRLRFSIWRKLRLKR